MRHLRDPGRPAGLASRDARGRCRAQTWAVGVILAAALPLAGLATGVRASTLSPGHPVWRTPGIDPARLRAALRAERQLYCKTVLTPAAAEAGKGFRAYHHRMLVIPVLFADTPAAPIDHATLERRFFDLDDPASVASFYREASGGRFVPEGTVVDWVRVPGTLRVYPDSDCYPYANIIDSNPTSDGGVRCLVRDALREAARRVDLSAFDDDGPDGVAGSGDDDGIVDLLVVLHPDVGFEVDSVDRERAILAHQGRIEPDPVLAEGGVVGDAYVVASAHGPLGVWVHEMGHLLGLEDLYDLDVQGTLLDEPNRGGLGLWSLMAHGTWGGEGERPSNLDAVSRRRLGWEDRPSVVSIAQTLTLDPVVGGDAESVEVRPLGAWDRETFVLENRRRRTGVVDGDLPGSGVLIYRVDDRLRLNLRSEGYWIEVLQADGRQDLEELQNNGDATDPYTGSPGADRLGPDTIPSSRSRTPNSGQWAPVIAVDPPGAGDRQLVSIQLSEGGALRLAQAFFLDTNQSQRLHLRLGETAPWRLRFSEVGTAPTAASLALLEVDPRLDVSVAPGESVPVVEQRGWWVPQTPIVVQDLDPSAGAAGARVRLRLEADGLERTLDLGIPVGNGPGLDAETFSAWNPAVLAASQDTTRFTLLAIPELPLPTNSGWETFTNGAPGYASLVEITLTSPWFAAPDAGTMKFWSRHETEASQPGQAWDGGVLEVLLPDRGWTPLEPEGGPTVLINHGSQAATRGAVGFRGVAVDWQGYTAALPDVVLPVRVRLRFGSDRNEEVGSWAVAGLGTDPAPGTAEIVLRRSVSGELLAEATFAGNLRRVTTVRFRARRPLDTEWLPVSQVYGLRPDLPRIVAPLQLPEGEPILLVGIFAEVGDLAPPLLLGSVGYRSEATSVVRLRAFPNPARGRLVLELAARDESRELRLYDVRGRQVRSLLVPPHFNRVEWDGTDDAGRRVAAGRYVVRLASDPSVRRSVVFVP
jgi:M6 family metalloprotease-like protein